MRRAMLLAISGLVAATPVPARIALGQFGAWGAFREPPAHCFAMAEPAHDRPKEGGPFIAIGLTHKGGPPRLHVVPGRSGGGPLWIEIGDRTFALAGAGGVDARADARIIAAIRRADRLRVLGTDARGRHFHDDYTLAGAPSAIDAAIVGCL